jgi:CYTH domain-containing protein
MTPSGVFFIDSNWAKVYLFIMQEIERKFLVGILPELSGLAFSRIEQGYLIIGGDGTELRVRDNNGKYTQTFKQGHGLSRTEVEVRLEKAQFEKLWPLTAGKRISKTRYIIPYKQIEIELDIYHGPLSGLMTAEVEFESEASSRHFKKLPWMGREVTGDPLYLNQRLAAHGLPDVEVRGPR